MLGTVITVLNICAREGLSVIKLSQQYFSTIFHKHKASTVLNDVNLFRHGTSLCNIARASNSLRASLDIKGTAPPSSLSEQGETQFKREICTETSVICQEMIN